METIRYLTSGPLPVLMLHHRHGITVGYYLGSLEDTVVKYQWVVDAETA